jgi:hypothetical protein
MRPLLLISAFPLLHLPGFWISLGKALGPPSPDDTSVSEPQTLRFSCLQSFVYNPGLAFVAGQFDNEHGVSTVPC